MSIHSKDNKSVDVKTVPCPQCGKASVWSTENEHRPFCSERCKLIDLGAWASEEYQIAASPSDEYEDYSTGMDAEAKPFTPTVH